MSRSSTHHFFRFIPYLLLVLPSLPLFLFCPTDSTARQNLDYIGNEEFIYPEVESPVLPASYAIVNGKNAPVYVSPVHHAAGLSPVRHIENGFITLSLKNPEPVYWEGHPWYRIGNDEYVSGEHIRLLTPSLFQGVVVPPYFDKALGWMVFHSRTSPEPGVPAPENSPLIPGQSLAIIYEIVEVEGKKWCRTSGGWWVEYERLGLVTHSPRPAGVGSREKWIEVNLFEQTLAAYEGDRMVYTTLISSGDRDFPTVKGLFRIWAKVKKAKMSGGVKGNDYYYVDNVPWQMYFHKSYALHTSYWHNFYGIPSSHGCVNLSPKDAKWLYEWALPREGKNNWTHSTGENPGTWVWVHDTVVTAGTPSR